MYKVGFFTAKHLEIDGKPKTSHNVVLQSFDIKATSDVEAVEIAKSLVDLPTLRSELTRRWPNAKFVSYTVQKLGKNQPRTWMRSFLSWRIINA